MLRRDFGRRQPRNLDEIELLGPVGGNEYEPRIFPKSADSPGTSGDDRRDQMGHESQSPIHAEAPLKRIKGVTPGHLDTAEGRTFLTSLGCHLTEGWTLRRPDLSSPVHRHGLNPSSEVAGCRNPNFSTCSCTSRGAKVLATGHGAQTARFLKASTA